MTDSRIWDVILFILLIGTFIGFIDLAARPIHGILPPDIYHDNISYRTGVTNLTSGGVDIYNSTGHLSQTAYTIVQANGTFLGFETTFNNSCQAADKCTVEFDYYSNTYLWNSRDRNIAMLLYLGIFVTGVLWIFGLLKKGD